ncbi:MAG: TIGR02757 family protein [Bacteroidia bacterium]
MSKVDPGIKALLDEKLLEFNRPGFIEADPVAVPHRFSRKEDIEIAGFLAATIAWGRRDLIVRAGHGIMDLMDDAPYEFVTGANEEELERLRGFVYRTFQGIDLLGLVLGLRRIYAECGGLETVMALAESDTDTGPGILRLRREMLATEGFAGRTAKHIANPEAGASAKRLNMFLRWMVRRDGAGVDFGIWKSVRPDQLICPLDTHTGTVGRKLGLLTRKQDDWRAALELTEALRKMDPTDPVKYDFSLFGLGIFEKF